MAVSGSSSPEPLKKSTKEKSTSPPPAAPAETEAVQINVARLKNDMKRLVNEISEADEYSFETLHETVNVMRCLKEYLHRLENFREAGKEIEADFDIPELFKCPISHKLMKDPVVLSNGETCDRAYVEQWLREGKRTSPASGEVILHPMVVPNDFVRDMISKWEKEFGRVPPQVVQDIDKAITEDELARAEAGKLDLEDLLHTINVHYKPDAEKAATRLRALVTRSEKFRASFGRTMLVHYMLGPIYRRLDAIHSEYMREDLIITLYHLSRYDENKEFIMEHTGAFLVLNESLTRGTSETIRYAVGTLFSLSKVDSIRLIIGPGALKTLLNLLDEGDPWNMSIIAAVVNWLCTAELNLHMALYEGAIGLALKKIKVRVLVEEMLELLSKLSAIREAREEMIKESVKSYLKGLPSEFHQFSQVKTYCHDIDKALNTHLKDPLDSIQDSPEEIHKNIGGNSKKPTFMFTNITP